MSVEIFSVGKDGSCQQGGKRVKVKIFTVTKDEYDLVEDFILYHAAVFGPKNVVIIDNGSTDQRVLDIYAKHASLIELLVRPGYQGELQGDHFTEAMNLHRDSVDILIGLDTDDFIINGVEGPVDPAGIHAALQWVYESGHEIIRFSRIFNSVSSFDRYARPVREIVEFGDYNESPKVFYRASTFLRANLGNHSGISVNGKLPTLVVNLSLLHFRDTGWMRSMERAERICIGYDYIDVNDPLPTRIEKLQRRGGSSGFHRVNQYLNFIKDTQAMFANPPKKGHVTVTYPGLKEFLGVLA
jgi:hypothetical protein